MAKEVIGHITCGYCGYEEAEVKETKKVYQGKAIVMVWCPHPKCQSQHFPRGKDASESIRAKMKPARSGIDVSDHAAEEPQPAPKVEPAPQTSKVRKSLAEELGI